MSHSIVQSANSPGAQRCPGDMHRIALFVLMRDEGIVTRVCRGGGGGSIIEFRLSVRVEWCVGVLLNTECISLLAAEFPD